MKTPTIGARFVALSATAVFAAGLIAGCGSSSSKPGGPATATDKAFVRQMVPHHQMAVQMARTAVAQGRHQQVRALAGDIIKAQNGEIAQMKQIADRLSVKVGTAASNGMRMGSAGMSADAKTLGIPTHDMGMTMDMRALDGARPFDRGFVDAMVPHHQGAVRMAQAELAKGQDPQLRKLATAIVAAQDKEIGAMNQWRTRWYGSASPAGGVPG